MTIGWHGSASPREDGLLFSEFRPAALIATQNPGGCDRISFVGGPRRWMVRTVGHVARVTMFRMPAQDSRVSSACADLSRSQTVRERLLAKLAIFFAIVALLLAGIGAFGVLDYSVLQRRHEIAIRMAVGAPAYRVAGMVIWGVFRMVALGAMFGSGLGLGAARYVDAMLYGVKPTDPGVLLGAGLIMLAAAGVAAIAPAARAVRIDPVAVLKVE